MPITKGAEKKLRQDKKRQIANLVVKREVSSVLNKFRKSPNEKLLSQVYSALDTSVKKNINHKNKVARLKSRLSKHIKTKISQKAAK